MRYQSSFWLSWRPQHSEWPPQPSSELPEGLLTHLQNRYLWRWILAAMFIPLALIAFWPSPVDQPFQNLLTRFLYFVHVHGVPAWFNYKFVETSANVALFIPLGLSGGMAFPKRPWWKIGALGLLISCCIELGQLLFLHSRFASLLDIVTNTSGAVMGALLAAAALKLLQARPPSGNGPVVANNRLS